MESRPLLSQIKYHWHLYIARGGFNEPSTGVGKLEGGGLFHWNRVLQLGRQFAVQFPSRLKELEEVVGSKTIKLLTGE